MKNLYCSWSLCMVVISVLFFNLTGMAQPADAFIKLSKDSLIMLAAKNVTEPTFRAQDFNNIEVWQDGDQVYVVFDHAIRFIPKKGQYYYSVTVDLVTGSPSMSILGEGPLDQEVGFYDPSRFKKEIQFVIDAINNSNGEIGKIPEGQLPSGTMTIHENTMYYDITVDSESTHSYYKIKKGSGKIYDAGHKHYARFTETRKRIY